MDESTYLRLRRWLREPATTPSQPSASVNLRDQENRPRPAGLTFGDGSIDGKTGKVSVRATLPNPDDEVVVGEWAVARFPMPVPRKVLAVPKSAVGSFGPSWVFVANEKGELTQRRVTPGIEVGNFIVIDGGLQADD